jgi:hypothetical protein
MGGRGGDGDIAEVERPETLMAMARQSVQERKSHTSFTRQARPRAPVEKLC